MKKIITPIIYSLFILPTFILTLSILSLYDSFFELRSIFGRQGDLEGAIIFLVVAVGIFYFGNIIIQRIERIKQPLINDHFRQSALLYVLFIWQTIQQLYWLSQYPISECQSDCHAYAIGALFVLIPLLGIIINALYLIRKGKTKIT